MKLIFITLCALVTSCGTGNNTGQRGNKGPPGEIIYGPGTGLGVLVTECSYTWGQSESFNYWNKYVVRRQDNGNRLVMLCTTQKKICTDTDFTKAVYTPNAAGYSEAKISDGLVEAKLVGTSQAMFVNYFNENGQTDCAVNQTDFE